MGIVTVGLNEHNRASQGRINMLQPPGGSSTILSQICGPSAPVNTSPAKLCHSDTSSENGEETTDGRMTRKPYRLASSVVLGDESAPQNQQQVRKKTSIKVMKGAGDSGEGVASCVVASDVTCNISDASAPPEKSVTVDQNVPTPAENGTSTQDSAPARNNVAKIAVVDATPAIASDSTPAEESVANTANINGNPTVVPANAENSAEKSNVSSAAPDCAEPSAKSCSSPAASSPGQTAASTTQTSAFANMSSELGSAVPKITRRQPPGGHSTRLW